MVDDERVQVEDPAITVLTSFLGWTNLPASEAESMRGSTKEVFLYPVLNESIRRLNPWISDENRTQVIRAITKISATSISEANEKAYEIIERGTTVRQDTGDGIGFKGRTVKLIDFDVVDNNQFHIVRQLRVEHHQTNIPDIVLFINGMPITVLECKSPYIARPLEEGKKQVFRYQEIGDGYRNLGCPLLFTTVQIVGVLAADQAKYGTVLTPWQHYSEWLDTYPVSLDEIESHLGKKLNKQELLLFGLFNRQNLLDMIRNFVVFEREGGRIHKKLAKYMQFRAVNKTLQNVIMPERQGGIIWHWQGSGKSLTMLWIAVKLRRLPQLRNPTILVVTDRKDLDRQIHGTFNHCGFPSPIQAGSCADLQRLLSKPVGQTIMTTIQKFQETVGLYPELSKDPNIFVLADEAHATQYGILAANMRKALPNACFLGFTGTPIAKRDRNTFETFGPYIDRYDHVQSIADGVTVPIKYFSKLPNLEIAGGNIDAIFDRVFADYPPAERERIKKQYATQEAIATSPHRIREISSDLIKHFEAYIEPNGFKGQIVTLNREAAVAYYDTIRELNGPSCEVLISSLHNQEDKFANVAKDEAEEQEIIRRFKEEEEPKLLIVCDKLIKGFDAPIEQVMYLDKPLKEHTLLQAIGRVNRKCEGKEYGLIVDYWGLLPELNTALHMYDDNVPAGMVEIDYIPTLLNRVEAACKASMNYFVSVEKSGEQRRYDELCVDILEPEDVRIRFNRDFREFSLLMDMLLPHPSALPFIENLKWLGKIRLRAKQKFFDETLDLSECSDKVKKLVQDYLTTSGITDLHDPVTIHSAQFDQLVESLPNSKSKASEISHAISHEIHIKMDEDPVLYASLRERLEQIIEENRQKRIDDLKYLDELKGLLEEARNPQTRAEKMGVEPHLAPLYGILSEEIGTEGPGVADMTRDVYASFRSNAVVGWENKSDAQREIRRSIKELLRSRQVPSSKIENLSRQVIELMKHRKE